MKNRIRKKNLYSRCKLPRQFVKDTKRALAEAKAGKLIPYKYGQEVKKSGPLEALRGTVLRYENPTDPIE